MEDTNKTAKLLVATLQKYGYDLEYDARDSGSTDELSPTNSTSSSTRSSSSSSSISSASILQLRERKNNQSALHIAAKKGHLDVLKALAKLPRVQDHLNTGDRHGNTALHFAASNAKENAADMVEYLLLTMGASVNVVNVRGQTPLAIHILTTKKDNPIITQLCVKKKEIDLNEQINGTTYLHMALERELIEIACALVMGGASINIPDHTGATVGDIVPKKVLVKLVCCMQEGTQLSPSHVVRNSCKICKNPKGLLDTLKDCNLCGRCVCKNCSKKASEIKSIMAMNHSGDLSYPMKEKEAVGRLCQVCCTVVLLRDKQQKAKTGFNQKLYGCGMK